MQIRILEGPGGLLGSFFAIFEAWSGTFGFLGGFCRIPGAFLESSDDFSEGLSGGFGRLGTTLG